MPSLTEILQDTYVMIASKAGGKLSAFEAGSAVIPKRPAPSADGPPSQAIWHWTYQTSSNLRRVEAVEAWSPMMMEFHPGASPNIAWLTVLTELEFGPVHVTLPNHRVELPLTPKFFARGFLLESGTNRGDKNSWWPLAADVDASFLSVFAYDITDATTPESIQIVPSSVLDSGDFMPAPGGVPSEARVPAGKSGIVELSPRHFVCVCLSLVCTKMRADFEPGGILGVGRLVPHIMVMSNRKLDRLEAELKLQRPAQSGYFGTFENPSGARVMNHGDMDTKMGALVVTDTNDFRSVDQAGKLFNIPANLPYWDLIFDYYRASVPDGEIVKADVPFTASTKDSRGTRHFRNEAKVLDYSKVEERVSKVKTPLLLVPGLPMLSGAFSDVGESLLARAPLRLAASEGAFFEGARALLYGGELSPADYLPRKAMPVRKIQRQADFDSVHIAPRMKADQALAEEPKLQASKWQLDSIAMAPFCEHDCLHTHWRWGENWTTLEMKPIVRNLDSLGGFSASNEPKFRGVGKPYQVIGSTMVPLNQKVESALNAKGTGFTYSVEAEPMEAGVWQVINHHGSAYSLAITNKPVVIATSLAIAFRDLKGISELYWNMRFQATTNDRPLERIQYTPSDLLRVING